MGGVTRPSWALETIREMLLAFTLGEWEPSEQRSDMI